MSLLPILDFRFWIRRIHLWRNYKGINLLGAANRLNFEVFVIQKLVPKLWQGAGVVWDNNTIHQGVEVEKAIRNAGARLINLPPDSPDFNSIKNLRSKLKNSLRALGARTYLALDEAISYAFTQVSLPIAATVPR